MGARVLPYIPQADALYEGVSFLLRERMAAHFIVAGSGRVEGNIFYGDRS
jgi:hypothetical protein